MEFGKSFSGLSRPTRYCINSAALDFEPLRKDVAFLQIEDQATQALQAQSRSETVSSFLDAEQNGSSTLQDNPTTSTLGLAGGCYWGLQQEIDSIQGVQESHVGFMGGPPGEHPTYESLETLNARHPGTPWVETVYVTYSNKPDVLERILNAYAQFNDTVNHGQRYSRAVFGDSHQLDAIPASAHARLMPSSLTRFEASQRPFDEKYYARGL